MTGGPSRNFNPRAPCGARPETNKPLKTAGKFQSTRPVRGATSDGSAGRPCGPISIHAPRAGRDKLRGQNRQLILISIHAPRAGRDADRSAPCRFYPEISIHAPRAGRDSARVQTGAGLPISIHAPRAGRDVLVTQFTHMADEFQSTRPVRGATSGAGLTAGGGPYFNPRAPCGARQTHCLPGW